MILTIDPGFDDTGYALFAAPERTVPLDQVARYRMDSGTIRTNPALTDAERLMMLAAKLEQYIKAAREIPGGGVRTVVVERPAKAGTYARHRANAQTADGYMPATMEKAYLATGVCCGVAATMGARLVLAPAPRLPKVTRHERVRWYWPDLGRTSADERDALYIGVQMLTDVRRKWAA